jgi:hypothetical protein
MSYDNGLHCPVFLLTQQHWKLFVENGSRDRIYTFPHVIGQDGTPYAMHQVGIELIYAIAICFLSQKQRAILPEATAQATTLLPVGPSRFPTVSSPK